MADKIQKLHVYSNLKIIPHLTTQGTAVKLKKPFHSPNHGISKVIVELGPKPEAYPGISTVRNNHRNNFVCLNPVSPYQLSSFGNPQSLMQYPFLSFRVIHVFLRNNKDDTGRLEIWLKHPSAMFGTDTSVRKDTRIRRKSLTLPFFFIPPTP